MNNQQIEKAAKESLSYIIDYLNLNHNYKRNAALLNCIEEAIKKNIDKK